LFCFLMAVTMQHVTHHRVFGRVHLVLNDSKLPIEDPASPFEYFTIGSELVYHPFCDDFGPMNLLMLHKFCRKLDIIIQRNSHRSTALVVTTRLEDRTGAALFLGTYMVMRMDFEPEEAAQRLSPLNAIPFRDILPSGQLK
jgi:hypothetical protein